MRFVYLFTLGMLLNCICANAQHSAQDTVLKASTIEVLQSYKPQVKQAPKPEWIPQLPAADTSHPVYTYDVPQQTLYYTYNSLPLRPLALGKEIPPIPFRNYVMAGAGNLSTIFADAGVGSIRGANSEMAFHLHYLSQTGNIKYQQSSSGGIEAEWLQHNHKTDWHTVLNGEMNQYNFYGYNHDIHPSYTGDSLKQTYTTFYIAVDMKNNDNKAKLSYNPEIDASYYGASFNTSEVNVGIRMPFEYKFDNAVQAILGVSGDDAHFATKDTSRDNTIATFSPGIRIHTGHFNGHAIISYALGVNSIQYLLPDVQVSLTIPHSMFTISAGYQASLAQNTYQQLSGMNPYMFNTFAMMQTKSDEIYGQLVTGIGGRLNLSGRVSWWSFSGLPEFLNDLSDNKQFYLVYDTVNALSVKLSVRYKLSQTLSVGGLFDLYNYTGGKQRYVWGMPGTKVKGDITFILAKKLVLSGYIYALAGIYAKNDTHAPVALDPAIDIGGNAEYQIVKRLSVFAQLSNLLNSEYYRWYGYRSYGLNIYGGLRLKF